MTIDMPRVLVIEDSPGLVRVLMICLRQAGYETLWAGTGNRALDILEKRRVDAVVLDLQLPDDSGPMVLDWLRDPECPPDSRPVWMVITALDYEDAAKRFGPLDSPFLPKPFDPWMLVEMLERTLQLR